VLLIMFENKGYAATLGSCSADPYFCSLASQYATFTNSHGVSHPSLPNYLAFDSGSTQGQTTDCTTCGPFAAADLGGQLSAARIPWKAYMESMPSPCYTGGSSGAYAKKHNPFVYFTDVLNNACAAHDVPYPGAGGLVSQLDGAGAPDYVFITPNLLNDMHDGTVRQGDNWLKANLTPILASSWFTRYNSSVIVTMDEGDSGTTNQVPTVVISSKAKGVGAISIFGNHYGALRSIEEAYRLRMLGGAQSASYGDLVRYFG
jgi:phosphatidylinositol-3-phosphatase